MTSLFQHSFIFSIHRDHLNKLSGVPIYFCFPGNLVMFKMSFKRVCDTFNTC